MLQTYALSVDATADDGNAIAAGEQRSLLVLARADSVDEAIDIAMVALAEYRWTDARLSNVAPLSVPVETIADQTLREAATFAEANGYALVAF